MRTFSLLHAVDFADRFTQVIAPALKAGFIVLADRYAYTAFARDVARGVDPSWVRQVYNFAIRPDLAIYFDIDTQILIDRIIYRQSCPKCGEIYNKKFKPSRVEDVCDKCGSALKTRADDNEETAKARFDTYFRETAPLVEFYEKKGVLYKIDANGSIDEVWERLLKIINQ